MFLYMCVDISIHFLLDMSDDIHIDMFSATKSTVIRTYDLALLLTMFFDMSRYASVDAL